MQKQKIVALGFVFITLIGFFLYFFTQENKLFLQFLKWNVTFSQKGFAMKSFSKSSEGEALSRETLTAQSNSDTLFITRSKVSNNKKMVEDKRFILKAQYEPVTADYPGIITNIISCPADFKPKEETVSNGFIFNLYAGQRYNYGICSKDLITYNSSYGIFDCGTKGIFEVMDFTKGSFEKATQVVKSFSC
jgi:hypothetical protein